MIKLYTDTSANLPTRLLKKYDISVIPYRYSVNGEDCENSQDKEFDGKTFYDNMRSGADIKTSMISSVCFYENFEREIAQGNAVIYIGMSGGISGTAAAASSAVTELSIKYPNAQVAAIDTFAASLGEGILVLEAARLIKRGMDFSEVTEVILQRRNYMCQFFTVDRLDYLKKGGRISAASYFVGTVLNIKPILKGDVTGKIVLDGKVRGSKKALDRLAEKFSEFVADKTQHIGIAHADNEEGAKYLLTCLREYGFSGDCLNVVYEPVTGSHVGPGTVALFFFGSEPKA